MGYWMLVPLVAMGFFVGCGSDGGMGSDTSTGGNRLATGGAAFESGGSLAGVGGAAPAETGGTAPAAGGSLAGGTGATPVKSGPDPALSELLAGVATLDAASLAERYAVPFRKSLGYDPLSAAGYEQLQASHVALVDSELAALAANGFVILGRLEQPSFAYGYAVVYGDDLPVYVSADSVLDAIHRSYDAILKDFERRLLVPELGRLLGSMRTRLAGQGLAPQIAADLDFYLTLAKSLLDGALEPPVTGLDPSELQSFYNSAFAASGAAERELFGVSRWIDFSQFKPRGHYAGVPELEQYFRAMMWLGRTDLRLLETLPSGEQVFRRRQLEAALGLRALMDASAMADWVGIDAVIGAFVGEHDYMTVPQLDRLLGDLGLSDLSQLGSVSDQTLVDAIVAGGYGAQRIASQILIKHAAADWTFPLDRSFAFFGQRYVVDSHVFSNLVMDRVGGGKILRVLPSPLDAAFAAFGNDQAVSLLADELARYPYASDLAGVRVLVDAHPPDYWETSLYTAWLGALRTLSPSAPGARPAASGLPAVAGTEPWGRRLLNTQLGSWAELRHDTLLYAKQSYTIGTDCSFPDGYVEPYPEFFAKLVRLAERAQELIASLDLSLDTTGTLGSTVQSYFANVARVAETLRQMAEYQRTGQPHTSEQIAFLNQAVRISGGGSGPPFMDGWYRQLLYTPTEAVTYAPTIADVHTDAGGDVPPRSPSVLHVGTGRPRLMVVSADGCEGPRLYVGPVFAYHERIEPGLTRLTDADWEKLIAAGPQPDVPWMAELVAR